MEIEHWKERRGNHNPERKSPEEGLGQIQTGAMYLLHWLVGLDLNTILGQGDFWQQMFGYRLERRFSVASASTAVKIPQLWTSSLDRDVSTTKLRFQNISILLSRGLPVRMGFPFFLRTQTLRKSSCPLLHCCKQLWYRGRGRSWSWTTTIKLAEFQVDNA